MLQFKTSHLWLFGFLFFSICTIQAQEERPNLLCDDVGFDYRATNTNFYKIRLDFSFEDSNQSIPTDSELKSLVDDVNVFFEPQQIEFHYACNKYIFDNILDQAVDHPGAIDLWVFDNATNSSVQSVPATFATIKSSNLDEYTLAHEIGHCLGLLHTHNSYDEEPPGAILSEGGDPVTCFEFPHTTPGVLPTDLDGGCLHCGDCLCDTEADPNLDSSEFPGRYDAENCTYTGGDIDGYPYNPDPKNIMSYARDCWTYFTDGQGTRMRNFIENVSYLNKTTILEDQTLQGISLLQGEELNQMGNTIIESSLLTDGNIYIFGADSKIYFSNQIEQISGGTTFTGCEWEGIVVQDNKVTFNDVFISNANVAIKQDQNQNEELIVTNSTFDNNNIGLYLRYKDGSVDDISGNTFKNGVTGIAMKSYDGLLEGNYFENFTECAIYGKNSHTTISGTCQDPNQTCYNEIKNSLTGIYMGFPAGLDEPIEISDYQISNGVTGIRTVGGSGFGDDPRIFILNNEISNHTIGAYFDGANTYDIVNNTINVDNLSIVSVGAGSDRNLCSDNEIDGGFFGTGFIYGNTNTQVVTNCYGSHTFTDLYASSFFTDQGTEDNGNGNCFGTDTKELYAAAGTSSFFEYFEPETNSTADPCTFVEATGNFSVEEATSVDIADNCGSTVQYTGSGGGPTSLCNPTKTEANLTQVIQDLINLISSIQNNPNLSQTIKNRLIKRYTNCLRNARLYLVDILVSENRDQEAQTVLTADGSFAMRAKMYTILVKRGLYTNALQYLNNIGAQSDEEMDFVYAQELLLQSLANRQYQPTTIQLDSLRDISLQTQPINGYARAVLHWFTDEMADVDLNIDFTQTRGSGSYDNQQVSIHPNPLFPGSNLTFTNLPKGDFQVKIYTISGQNVFNGMVTLTNNTLFLDLQNGLYIVTIPALDVTDKLYIHE